MVLNFMYKTISDSTLCDEDGSNVPLVSEGHDTLVSRASGDSSLGLLVEDGLSTGHHVSLDQLLGLLHLLPRVRPHHQYLRRSVGK